MCETVALIVPRASWVFACGGLLVAFCLAGCAPDMPVVSQEGAIVGGDPKLNSLLHMIKDMRDAYALASEVTEASYVASVQPTPQAVCYEGVLPATDKVVDVRYSFVTSRETLGEASVAVVTQFLLLSEKGGSQAQSYSVLLLWRNDRWEELPITRMSVQEMRANQPSMTAEKALEILYAQPVENSIYSDHDKTLRGIKSTDGRAIRLNFEHIEVE